MKVDLLDTLLAILMDNLSDASLVVWMAKQKVTQ
jgi:hypothetical protein